MFLFENEIKIKNVCVKASARLPLYVLEHKTQRPFSECHMENAYCRSAKLCLLDRFTRIAGNIDIPYPQAELARIIIETKGER